MKILEFNINKGLYHFEFEELSTEFHAHPLYEIIHSPKGDLKIETYEGIQENLHFAIISANTKHKVSSSIGTTSVFMIEGNNTLFEKVLRESNLDTNFGIYAKTIAISENELIKIISAFQNTTIASSAEDSRVQSSLNYLNSNSSDYNEMMVQLKSDTNLSESRLSHLFKKEVGISMKKYLVWSRLKRTFHLVISENTSMYQAALECGFYDQAHLSKAFKQMLGLSPSGVYNSRMLQE